MLFETLWLDMEDSKEALGSISPLILQCLYLTSLLRALKIHHLLA